MRSHALFPVCSRATAQICADVDAILSSALSELGLDDDGDGGGGGGDTVVRVSGEEMAARVEAWQRSGNNAEQ